MHLHLFDSAVQPLKLDTFTVRVIPPFAAAQAFKSFAKLWRFQQEHRAALTDAGLRRWEIGEIASRVGQLYYAFYLRTGEGWYLSESHAFFDAASARDLARRPGSQHQYRKNWPSTETDAIARRLTAVLTPRSDSAKKAQANVMPCRMKMRMVSRLIIALT